MDGRTDRWERRDGAGARGDGEGAHGRAAEPDEFAWNIGTAEKHDASDTPFWFLEGRRDAT